MRRAALLFAAVLLGALLAPAADAQQPAGVVVNEILYDPADPGSEFVELLNRSESAVTLQGLQLADARQDSVTVSDAPVTIPAGDFLVLAQDSAGFAAQFPDAPNAPVEPSSWPQLNNGGDAVVVYTGGATLDSVRYDPGWGGGDGVSLERLDPAAASNDAGNFASSTAEGGGTPGARNSVFAPDRSPPRLTSVRVFGDGDMLRTLFSEPLDPSSVQASNFSVTGSPATVTAATARRDTVVLALGNALESGDYVLVARDVADPAGNAQGRTERAFSFVRGAVPTAGDLVVNEVFYDPPDEDQEFVEILNVSDKTFDLSDFSLADNRDEPVPLSDSAVALASGDYAVLARDAGTFAAAFPTAGAVDVADWPALNNGGDRPALYYQQTVIDSVPYAPSWGGADGSSSLERIDPNGPVRAFNFGSSQNPPGATPGTRNSIFAIDEAPPDLQAVRPNETGDTLRAVFSEPLDPETVQPADFSLEGASEQFADVAMRRDTVAVLTLDAALESGDYTLVARDVADLNGNALDRDEAAFTFFVGDAAEPGDLVVNEIFYDPPDEDQEFVEILNVSDKTFDLSDLALADSRDTVRLTATTQRLAPGGYAVLVRSESAFVEAFPQTDFVEVTDWSSLQNGGDAVRLFYDDAVVDAVPYAPSWGGNNDSTSLERRDPAGPSASAVNFSSSEDPRGATPGAQNSIFGPDEAAPQPVFAEQRDEHALRVTFDEPLDSASVQPSDFQLGGSAPASVSLSKTTAQLRFDAPVDAATLTVTGVRDLTGNALGSAEAAVAFRPAPGEVVVNEILFAPRNAGDDDLPDQPEFVELLNRTDRRLALSRSFFTDAPNEDGEADTVRFAPERTALAPGGFAVAFSADGSDLAASFPQIDFARDSITLLPVGATTLGLSNSEDVVVLHRRGGATLDSVVYDDGWHRSDLDDARGVSLERIRAGGSSEEVGNWTSSVAEAGATPGRPNAVSVPTGGTAASPTDPGLRVEPSPFSPDGDGFEDTAVIRYTLERGAASIRVRIYDQTGRLVRTLRRADLAGRTGAINWDGRDDAGDELRLGVYVIVLDAVDADGGHTASYKEPVVLARPLG
jgi:hypothetical protein